MFRTRKTLWIVIGGTLILALAIISGAVVTTTVASAQSARNWMSGGSFARGSDALSALAAPGDGLMHRGGPGFPGGRGGLDIAENQQYLADALGITVEELQAAHVAANDAALDQAVANGDLTQAQADAIRTLRDLDGFGGFKLGAFRGFRAGIDMDALLADALNISVDELQAARQEAAQAALDAAVANGDLTQEQADLMQARQALRGYIDNQALTAQVLGLSVDDLQAAREAGTTMEDLLNDAGLTAAEFRTALQAAHEAAIQQAVEDGVITQEQADALQSGDGIFGRGGFPGGGRGPGRGGRGVWGPGAPDGSDPAPVEPTPNDGSTGANG